MANTIYASFVNADLAEKAAGALLDHGVRSEDLSIVQGHKNVDGTFTSTANPSFTGENFNNENYTGQNPISENFNRDQYGTTETINNERLDRDFDNTEVIDQSDINRPGFTGNNETWTGNATTPDTDRQAYTGSTFGQPGITSFATPAPVISDVTPGAYGDQTYAASEAQDANRVLENKSAHDFDHKTGHDVEHKTPQDIEKSAKDGISTTTPADAGAGATKGAAWGLGIGAVAALAALTIPGFGLVIGGGALAAALGGVAATTGAGAVSGAVFGYLKDQGMDENVAKNYDKVVSDGGAILAVTLPSGNASEDEINGLLTKYGATHMNTSANRYLA